MPKFQGRPDPPSSEQDHVHLSAPEFAAHMPEGNLAACRILPPAGPASTPCVLAAYLASQTGAGADRRFLAAAAVTIQPFHRGWQGLRAC